MITKTIWISYDLGVRGDYENLYAWLDKYNASECGNNLAVFKYVFTDNLVNSLQKELHDSIEITKNTRIYVVYKDVTSNKVKGRFLFGGRRKPPWTGFAGKGSEEIDEDVDEA